MYELQSSREAAGSRMTRRLAASAAAFAGTADADAGIRRVPVHLCRAEPA